MKRILILIGMTLAAASAASAQSFAPAPSDVEVRARRPERAEGISSALALEAAQVAVGACTAGGFKTTAMVVDSAGAPIAMLSADGAAEITHRIASGKAMTASKLGISSGEARTRARADKALMTTLNNDPTLGSPRPGAYPIKVGDKILGALAVSGGPTGEQDEPCAKVAVALIDGRLAARTFGSNPLLDNRSVTFALPTDFKFEGIPGETRAKIYGDPELPGPYGIIYKWEPGHNSKPHSHSADRYGYVISGTWWMSTSSTEDKSTLVPVPAGSSVVHKANQVHWDGAVDTVTYVLSTGVGPINTKRLSNITLGGPVPAPTQPRAVTIATPGFLNNGGLDIISKAFQEETGIMVNIKYGGMDQVMAFALDGSTDAVFLPVDFMNLLAAKDGIKLGTRKRVGRSYQGLAVRKGGKVPDISTKEKFIAALESANLVLHSRCQGLAGTPSCSQTAAMISGLFDRPEMAKVKHAASPYGEGGDALARNEGDMAVQNISQILKWDNLAVVGPVPEEYGLYLDGVAAVTSKAPNAPLGQQFIDYATQKGTFPIWWSRGIDPRKGAN